MDRPTMRTGISRGGTVGDERRPRPFLTCALLIVATLWATACSGSSSTGTTDATGSTSASQATPSERAASPSETSASPSVDPALLVWQEDQSKACRTVVRLPKGSGNSTTGLYDGQIDQIRTWLRTVGRLDTPKEYRADLALVVKRYEDALTATQDALSSYLRVTATTIFPSEAAADAAFAEERQAARSYGHAINAAQKALISLSRHAGFGCAR